MKFFRNLVTNLVILLVIIATSVFLYQNYKDTVVNYLFGTDKIGILIHDTVLTVSVADDVRERQQGLSGVTELPALEGKLFIFDEEGSYGFWMKDMALSLDIIWIDNAQKIVHIEENVRPDSYPLVYNSPVPARFVLEVNAHFTSTFNIRVGDRILIPNNRLPADLRQ